MFSLASPSVGKVSTLIPCMRGRGRARDCQGQSTFRLLNLSTSFWVFRFPVRLSARQDGLVSSWLGKAVFHIPFDAVTGDIDSYIYGHIYTRRNFCAFEKTAGRDGG